MRVAHLLLVSAVAGAATIAVPVAATSAARPSATATQSIELSAAKRKRPRANRVRPQPGTQIACTRHGCRPIPPGCRIETEYNPFTWDPSGFDAVVCPR